MPKILLLGATGMVGQEVLNFLNEDPDWESIQILSRRKLPKLEGQSKIQVHVVDFDQPDSYESLLNVDVILCALGTTIKKAKTKEAFRKVDFQYPVEIAKLAKKKGVRHFGLISAMGANAKSSIFYNQVKGEVEDALLEINFPSCTILRPSLLLGERNEFRFGEKLASKFSFLFPPSYRPIEAKQVARVLVNFAKRSPLGNHILHSKEIQNFR